MATRCLAAAVLAAALVPAMADEARIRQTLPTRLPQLPAIDEVRRMPVSGLYEVRIDQDIFYTDEAGDFILRGEVLDTRTRQNLTQARVRQLSAIEFAKLPLKDAIVIRQGSGQRRMVVFADPNCGYCKQLERELVSLKDVTIYTLLYPVLGQDSAQKAKAIWCAADPARAWRHWMLSAQLPAAPSPSCDTSAIERVMLLGRRHRVQGTPGIVFEDNVRVPGAMTAEEVERHLASASVKR